ncbi:branched-chain amino acid ABC transporter permease [Labrys miyagiensis]|uniref:Branched-chain amino acid ABC transporter permease n=1 Tax=Labrys miyagiensis TaxID=346912 RepID=A0ABQ6CLJ8_9HYPH|nr:urea ABC transporter permease subunit UrtB [Labrys miyagiensis]GLS19589.1 branched-chain amino acid ABC transporter permease [Labrys miyagiensis]
MQAFLRIAGLVVVLLLGGLTSAFADAAAQSKLASEKFDDIEAGVSALATSGDPQASAVIGALADGKLAFDPASKALYYQKGSDTFEGASGSKVAAPPSGLKKVKVNNRIRRAIEAAQGALTLMAPDPATRLAAADAVFKSHDEAALPAIDKALSAETDTGVKQAMERARAAVVFLSSSASPADRVNAANLIAGKSDQDTLGLLQSLPNDAPQAVKDAAATGVKSINETLMLWSGAQNLWFGLSLASVLLLAAIGLAITFGVMGVINMAHGEMVMLGAYTTFVVQELIRSFAPGLFDYSMLVAIPLAFLVAGAVGVLIERTIIRWLYGRPLETLLATWGVSLVLQQAVRTLFGPTNQDVGAPAFMTGSFALGGLDITWNRLWIVVFAGLVFAALLLLLRFTKFGLQMRAVTQNRRMASAMGIRTNWVDAFTFGLGSGIAGLAGVALSQIDNVSPNLGTGYIIDSFLVVVFGGVGNLWGTLVGALTLGIANKLLEPFAGAVLGKIALLVLVILFIQKRPRGLFALKGRAVET